MTKPATLALLGLAAGFLVGFLWGSGTRGELSGATQTSYGDGVLTVRVNAGQALRGGLTSILG